MGYFGAILQVRWHNQLVNQIKGQSHRAELIKK